MPHDSHPLGAPSPVDWSIVASGEHKRRSWAVFRHPAGGPYELWCGQALWARVYMAPGSEETWAVNVLDRGWDDRPALASS